MNGRGGAYFNWLLAILTLAALGAITLSFPQGTGRSPVVVYLEDGPWVVTPLERDGTDYLPLVDLIRRLALPYTDATASGTLTIRGPIATLTVRTADGVRIDDEPAELDRPVLNEDGRWLVPTEFLTLALGRATGFGFRVSPARIIAANVPSTTLGMEATSSDGITRLTLRLGQSSNVRVQQDRNANRVTVSIDRAPLIPEAERLDYRDGAVRSVFFEDNDGNPRVVVATTPQVAGVRLVPSDENRTFFLELVTASAPAAPVTVAPPPAETPPATDRIESTRLDPLRVIVIDAGHGGLDAGTHVHGVLEKDITLNLARRLQATLEDRLNATIILTRNQDRALDIGDRVAIVNQSRADLLVSLHVGFSPDATESGGSVFIMKPISQPSAPEGASLLFVPWFEAYRPGLGASRRLATTLVDRLSEQIPEWPFAVREAPLGILASATTASIAVELGNANNPDDLIRLADPGFQNRVIDAIVASVQTTGTATVRGDD